MELRRHVLLWRHRGAGHVPLLWIVSLLHVRILILQGKSARAQLRQTNMLKGYSRSGQATQERAWAVAEAPYFEVDRGVGGAEDAVGGLAVGWIVQGSSDCRQDHQEGVVHLHHLEVGEGKKGSSEDVRYCFVLTEKNCDQERKV